MTPVANRRAIESGLETRLGVKLRPLDPLFMSV